MNFKIKKQRQEVWQKAISADYILACDTFAVDPEEVQSQKKWRVLAMKKRAVAQMLRDDGYSYPQIGWAMKKDHSTVMHMIKEDMRRRKGVVHTGGYCSEDAERCARIKAGEENDT